VRELETDSLNYDSLAAVVAGLYLLAAMPRVDDPG